MITSHAQAAVLIFAVFGNRTDQLCGCLLGNGYVVCLDDKGVRPGNRLYHTGGCLRATARQLHHVQGSSLCTPTALAGITGNDAARSTQTFTANHAFGCSSKFEIWVFPVRFAA